MNAMNCFISGMQKGLMIAVKYMLPAIIAAFVLIEVLKTSGLLTWIGSTFTPLMGLLGLPGEALAVLITAWASAAGAIGLIAAMAGAEILTPNHVAILLPGVLLMGSQLQFVGRILATAGLKGRYIPLMVAIGFINGLLAMLFMRVILP